MVEARSHGGDLLLDLGVLEDFLTGTSAQVPVSGVSGRLLKEPSFPRGAQDLEGLVSASRAQFLLKLFLGRFHLFRCWLVLDHPLIW